MKNRRILNPVLSAMFLAMGAVLPFLTGQLQSIGSMLLPMHIPVLLCGFICGWQYGAVVGFVLPLYRSMQFSMPVMFPSATAMAFELAAYGFLSGFLFNRMKRKNVKTLYLSMLISMLGGRVVWGTVMAIITGFTTDSFTFSAFVSGAFINAVPGIILQLVLIPAIMVALDKTRLVPFTDKGTDVHE